MADPTLALATLCELEAIALEPAADLERLVENLQRRQDLLDRLQESDVQGLPDPTRGDVMVRIRKLHDATQHALAGVYERGEELRAQQAKVVTARRAVRGYRPDIEEKSQSVDRRA